MVQKNNESSTVVNMDLSHESRNEELGQNIIPDNSTFEIINMGEVTSMNRKIYIAGPISNGGKLTPRGQYKSVREAERYYEAGIKAGWTPICPHLSYHAWINFEDDVHWPRWIEMDLDYLDSVMCVVRIPGESKGADMEVAYAKERGILVVKVQSPRNMTAELEMRFGLPSTRPELQKYLDMIKRNPEDGNA